MSNCLKAHWATNILADIEEGTRYTCNKAMIILNKLIRKHYILHFTFYILPKRSRNQYKSTSLPNRMKLYR